jgi:hypothetical protein
MAGQGGCRLREWHSVGTDGEDTYDFQPSGCNDAFQWWAKCEEKVFEDLRADKGIPVELKLTFRYVCPDSPYLSADAASGANDALPNAALEFFGAGDKRFYVDPTKRLQSSNKGATQKAQKLLAHATSALGGDPRSSAQFGTLAMPQAAPQPTPEQQVVTTALLRVAYAMEQIAQKTFGVDMANAPTAPVPTQPATPLEQTPFTSGASAGPAAHATNEQGAAQGDHEGDADSSEDEGAGLGADANGGDDDDDDDDGDGGDDDDNDNTPPSPPSPGEMVATQRRASTRARKAPRRSL